MKQYKKIFSLYLLFGLLMVLYVSVINDGLLLVIRDGMWIVQYSLFMGILGLFWLPYSILLVLSPYSEYYVFGDTPTGLILYCSAFVLLSLYLILKKQNAAEDSSQGSIMRKNRPGLIYFLAVFLLTILCAAGTYFQAPEPIVNKENIKTLSFAYGAGPTWHHTYTLGYAEEINQVMDALQQLPLEAAEPIEVNNALLSSDEIAFVVALQYEDFKKAKENNEIGTYIVLDDGHIIVEDFYRKDRHYKADYTAVQTVLKDLEHKATIGFLRMTRND